MTEAQSIDSDRGAAEEEAGTVVVRKQPKALSRRDPGQLARAFAESGFWKHVRTPAQAVVVMAAGEELGLTPLASLQGITIIEGRVGYTGNLIATLLRQHEHYDYRILERTNESCTLQFLLDGEPIPGDEEEGKVTFTVEDAKRAELVKDRSNWKKYPRAMCFNRALTEGVRAHFPDLTMGTPVYSTDEIEEIVEQQPAAKVEVGVEEVASLEPEALAQLSRGIDVLGLSLDDLNMELGSLGIDGLDPVGDRDEQLAQFTAEQAEALAARLQDIADEAAEAEGQEEGEGDATD